MRSKTYPSPQKTKAALHQSLRPAKEWAQHDWRLTLLPAAIMANVGQEALRVVLAICRHQKGRDWYPKVIYGLDDLAEDAGLSRPNLCRALRRLVRAQLLTVEHGGGRLKNTRTGKASIYRLGPSLTVSEPTQLTVSPETQYRSAPRISNSVVGDTPRPYHYPRVVKGDRGERTAALTSGPPTTEPSSPTISPSKFRALLEKTGLRTRSRVNAT